MSKKYIFDYIDNKKIFKLNDNINDDNFIYNKSFTFDNECLNSLKSNHRDSYKQIANNYINNKNIFDIETYNNDCIILNNASVNNNGIIKTEENDIFLNGGCLCGKIIMNNKNNYTKYENVISITSMWSHEIWHFPYEALVSLMTIPKDILYSSKIHVSKITNYIIQWFNLLNIDKSQLITGDIISKKLYIPRMGKCGNPYYSQVKWLKNIVNKNIEKNNNPEYIILIKRNNTRKLLNYTKLEKLLNIYCNFSKLKLYIHDDNKLPSLIEQQQIFSKAKIVFAPHGAGGINILSMNENSLYIEFLSTTEINICYSRLAYLCNINYKGIPMKNNIIDLKIIKNILNEL